MRKRGREGVGEKLREVERDLWPIRILKDLGTHASMLVGHVPQYTVPCLPQVPSRGDCPVTCGLPEDAKMHCGISAEVSAKMSAPKTSVKNRTKISTKNEGIS